MWHSFKLGARACSIILASISIEPVVTGNKRVISLSHKYSTIDYTVHNTQYDIGVNVSVIPVNMSVIPGILCMKRNALWSTTRKSPLGNICIVCRMYIYVCNIHWLWKHALIHSWHSSTTHKELIEAPLVVTCQAFQKLPQSSDNNTITRVFHMWHFAKKIPNSLSRHHWQQRLISAVFDFLLTQFSSRLDKASVLSVLHMQQAWSTQHWDKQVWDIPSVWRCTQYTVMQCIWCKYNGQVQF